MVKKSKDVEVIFKDNTSMVVTSKRLQFILGIKNIKSQLKTYQYI